MRNAIALRRLTAQRLANNPLATAHDVVRHLGAVQAQDYLASLWAIGARMRSAVDADVERAIEERRIVRCWPMRGTIHFVAAEDVHWMLELLAPRVLSRHRTRLERDFELDRATIRRARTVVERALRDGKVLTRGELYEALDRARIATGNGRGLHLVFALAHEKLICFGPRRGKQPTFTLLDEWAPPSPPRPREEALAELATRYLRSHGPATPVDLAWWAGLTPKEAKEAIALAGDVPAPAPTRKTTMHLLPPFDEYTVAYRDRSAIVDPEFARRVNAGGGLLNAVVVSDGRVIGTWKRTLRGNAVQVTPSLFGEITEREQAAITRAARKYARFLGLTEG